MCSDVVDSRLSTVLRNTNEVSRLLRNLRAVLHGGGGPQVGEVTCGRSPHLSCKRDQIKMRDYMDRRVAPTSM